MDMVIDNDVVFTFLLLMYVMTVAVCMHFRFCLMCVCLFLYFVVCGVFVAVECSLFLLSDCCMLCKRVDWVGGMLVFLSDCDA